MCSLWRCLEPDRFERYRQVLFPFSFESNRESDYPFCNEQAASPFHDGAKTALVRNTSERHFIRQIVKCTQILCNRQTFVNNNLGNCKREIFQKSRNVGYYVLEVNSIVGILR